MRLIDADKLNEALMKKSDEMYDIGEPVMSGAVAGCVGIVNHQPTVEVKLGTAPIIVSARWVVDEFGNKCSSCGEYLPDPDHDEMMVYDAFCRYCGAKMATK